MAQFHFFRSAPPKLFIYFNLFFLHQEVKLPERKETLSVSFKVLLSTLFIVGVLRSHSRCAEGVNGSGLLEPIPMKGTNRLDGVHFVQRRMPACLPLLGAGMNSLGFKYPLSPPYIYKETKRTHTHYLSSFSPDWLLEASKLASLDLYQHQTISSAT